jgi:hypothetical protein
MTTMRRRAEGPLKRRSRPAHDDDGVGRPNVVSVAPEPGRHLDDCEQRRHDAEGKPGGSMDDLHGDLLS